MAPGFRTPVWGSRRPKRVPNSRDSRTRVETHVMNKLPSAPTKFFFRNSKYTAGNFIQNLPPLIDFLNGEFNIILKLRFLKDFFRN